MSSSPQDKSCPLLLQHNILSEAFVVVRSLPRYIGRSQDMEHLLTDILDALNKIWAQSDWEHKYMHYKHRLSGLFADDEFRRTVRSLVKSFEEELTDKIIVQSAGAQEGCSLTSTHQTYSYALPKLMLSLTLRILHCTQVLWTKPITYDLAGATTEDICYIVENGIYADIDEAKILQNAKIWSQGIQEAGYNIIGLCASAGGAFYELLDNSSYIINIVTENLTSMEFIHLGKLIQLVFIPLVKYCPRDCWDEWLVELLEPLFSLCEDILYCSWFTFLHEGRPKVPFYFGSPNGPDDLVNQFEKQRLLKFTCSVSDLLGVLASENLNNGLSNFHHGPKTCMEAGVQDLKSISSTSIIGYLLLHNCFWRLSISLLGFLVDYEATKKALLFCNALIHLEIATNHERLKQFILNEILPAIILLIGDLKSAASKLSFSLNSTTKEDARSNVIRLCQEIYEVYIDNQASSDRKSMSDRFEDWLAQELGDLHTRADCAVPEDFPNDVVWNWEFKEEFERYLPAYMDMLVQVDDMDDCLEVNYLNTGILLEKLKPEFKARYGINSFPHPYLKTMHDMLERKRPGVYCRSRSKWISQFLTELITHKPYMKWTDCPEDILDYFPEICESQYDPLQCDPVSAVDIFCGSILCYWEPQFHPLIRESHKELLKTIALQLALAEESVMFEPLEPRLDDFLEHLQPYAWLYMKRKKEESGYFRIKEQARLHEAFDNHLASGSLDHRLDEFSRSKDDFVHTVTAHDFKDNLLATLDHDLMKMSLERRAKLVEWEHKISTYSQCLTSLLKNDEMKDELECLMNVLNAEGFFSFDSMDWDNKLFSDSIDKFNKMVFNRQCIDKSLVIRGIMDYHTILKMKDVDKHDAFGVVVSDPNYLWKKNLQQFWVTTRHYEHECYNTLARPLQKVFLRGGAPKPKYG